MPFKIVVSSCFYRIFITSTSFTSTCWKRLFMQVSTVVSIHQLYTLFDYLHLEYCFQCMYTLNSMFHKHLQQYQEILRRLSLVFHHIYQLSLKSYSRIRNVHHISSHFITFHHIYHISSHLSISLKSYSSIRNVHYISSHFITFHHFYQLFTKHLQPVQESFINYHST